MLWMMDKNFCNFQVQGVAEITPTFGGITAWAVEGVQWWEGPRWLSVVLPFSDNTMSWSGEHHGFIVKTFFKKNESVIATQRAFCRHFRLGRHATVPDWNTILLWVSNMRATGPTLKQKPSGWPQSVRTPENVQTVRASIEQSPRHSARKHTAALGISDRSVRWMLHQELRMHPYKMMLAQELSKRLGNPPSLVSGSSTTRPPCSCCCCCLAMRHIFICGTINKQNFWYWVVDNPRELHECMLHSPHVTV